MKNNLFIFFLFVSFVAISQNKRRIMHGKIMNDSLSVNRIHVINKTTQKGTLSNQYGDFAIPVKVNDTLVFSAVQFENYSRIVSEIDLQKLQVFINLNPRINQLDEILIKPISVAQRLNLPNADKEPKEKLDSRLDGHSKASVPIVLLTALLGGAGGIDNLYYVLSGERKKDRKLKKLIAEDKIADLNSKTTRNIRLYFKDDFFIYTIGIAAKDIDNFIDYCLKNNIVALYNEKRYLELIEIFFQERVPYLEQNKE